jgi:hypothetical protein
MTNNRKRPIGVMLIALGFLWNGCIGTIFLPFALAGGISAIDCALFLVCVVCALVGFGLWKLKNWARKSVLGLAIFWAIASVTTSFIYWKAMFLTMLGGTLVSVGWLAWYLMRPRVQFAFGVWNRLSPAGEWVDPPGLSKRGRLSIGILAGITFFFAFAVPLVVAVEAQMRSSGAYQLTMKTAQASPCVIQALGSPLESHGMITGTIQESSVKGSAELSIPLKGPLGKGNLNVEAKKLNGAWRIDSLIFTHGTGGLSLIPIQSGRPCE